MGRGDVSADLHATSEVIHKGGVRVADGFKHVQHAGEVVFPGDVPNFGVHDFCPLPLPCRVNAILGQEWFQRASEPGEELSRTLVLGNVFQGFLERRCQGWGWLLGSGILDGVQEVSPGLIFVSRD